MRYTTTRDAVGENEHETPTLKVAMLAHLHLKKLESPPRGVRSALAWRGERRATTRDDPSTHDPHARTGDPTGPPPAAFRWRANTYVRCGQTWSLSRERGFDPPRTKGGVGRIACSSMASERFTPERRWFESLQSTVGFSWGAGVSGSLTGSYPGGEGSSPAGTLLVVGEGGGVKAARALQSPGGF